LNKLPDSLCGDLSSYDYYCINFGNAGNNVVPALLSTAPLLLAEKELVFYNAAITYSELD
jgi:hypothetical protein